mmetsp:Transcript_5146/g.7856  ORF Transcript_5146/g.7856 Transcript_5146/m.7856 type:complete len:104 (-) Transcript_5146:93-404(-)
MHRLHSVLWANLQRHSWDFLVSSLPHLLHTKRGGREWLRCIDGGTERTLLWCWRLSKLGSVLLSVGSPSCCLFFMNMNIILKMSFYYFMRRTLHLIEDENIRS